MVDLERDKYSVHFQVFFYARDIMLSKFCSEVIFKIKIKRMRREKYLSEKCGPKRNNIFEHLQKLACAKTVYRVEVLSPYEKCCKYAFLIIVALLVSYFSNSNLCRVLAFSYHFITKIDSLRVERREVKICWFCR